MGITDTSRFISLILRHKPETIGITLDEHGWANVKDLIEGIKKTRPFDMDMLEEIVRTDNKQRYSFNEDKTLIRANQGHSISVDVELKKAVPPDILYHGTGEKYVSSIDKEGLLPKSRLKVDARNMQEDGFEFFLSVNGVWLTKEVPVKYIFKLAV